MKSSTLALALLAVAVPSVAVATRLYNRRQRRLQTRIRKFQQRPLHDWSPAFLQSKRQRTDPVADGVIRAILENNQAHLINGLFAALVRNDSPLPTELPQEAHDYFALKGHLPPWADPDLIAVAERVYLEHGPLISLILNCKSLPESYACAKGAMVLHLTGRLNEQQGAMNAYSRRIVETAQFVVNVMSPGGLAPHGTGICTALKVRLIHATIRHFLHQQPEWDVALFDEPINQEDKAGTLMSFSALVLEGLALLGVRLSPLEEEAFQHAWCVVGYFMGVDDDLLPNNVADARKLGHAILDHQMQESEHGKALTSALIRFNEEVSREPGLSGVFHEMLYFMMGKRLASLLGVQTDPSQETQVRRRVLALVGDVERLVHSSRLMEVLAEEMSKLLLHGMLHHMNHHQPIRFYLPESLKKDWGFAETA
ncbi:hypothetical protein SAMN05421823_110104 [Catalinimonas alkaloidigena]|uniref:ER-bound oxygenase mpaB/mpaB'/Rubber oxygenase catalytic domain-containing protein n=1 Tax=Catalinimonas alkaloidigena TaxID=1075417 RepID=A0A1G9QAN8_9BACT|nr:oxygenase MpaB family protein [Catalinimonas alkaloidigena]SDM08138.1 hypothetical protein SAMN05421823_110104 [Catalinimonas alkaloidigena]